MSSRHAAAAASTLLLLTPLALMTAPGARADATSAPAGTLTTQGQGSVMVRPDEGTVSIDVRRSATTTGPALSASNRVTDAIVAAARRLAVPAREIQTGSLSTSCGRVRVGARGHHRLIRRCSADESLTITTTTALLGQVIDAATRAGATGISGPDFSFTNPSAGRILAEKAAIADARSQADATAAQLGYTVTGVRSIVLDPQSQSFSSAASTGSSPNAAAPVPTLVHPGTEEVDATVSVVFTIAPSSSS